MMSNRRYTRHPIALEVEVHSSFGWMKAVTLPGGPPLVVLGRVTGAASVLDGIGAEDLLEALLE
jgi:hypothetical protein